MGEKKKILLYLGEKIWFLKKGGGAKIFIILIIFTPALNSTTYIYLNFSLLTSEEREEEARLKKEKELHELRLQKKRVQLDKQNILLKIAKAGRTQHLFLISVHWYYSSVGKNPEVSWEPLCKILKIVT